MRVFKKAAPSRLSTDIDASTDDLDDLDDLDDDGLDDEDAPLRSPTDSSRLLDQFGDRLCDHLHECLQYVFFRSAHQS